MSYLSHEEKIKIEQDWKELGWFTTGSITNMHKPTMPVTHYIMEIILAGLRVENYARSSAIGVKLCSEKYAEIASEQEQKMSFWFSDTCDTYYSKDKDNIAVKATSNEQKRMR